MSATTSVVSSPASASPVPLSFLKIRGSLGVEHHKDENRLIGVISRESFASLAPYDLHLNLSKKTISQLLGITAEKVKHSLTIFSLSNKRAPLSGIRATGMMLESPLIQGCLQEEYAKDDFSVVNARMTFPNLDLDTSEKFPDLHSCILVCMDACDERAVWYDPFGQVINGSEKREEMVYNILARGYYIDVKRWEIEQCISTAESSPKVISYIRDKGYFSEEELPSLTIILDKFFNDIKTSCTSAATAFITLSESTEKECSTADIDVEKKLEELTKILMRSKSPRLAADQILESLPIAVDAYDSLRKAIEATHSLKLEKKMLMLRHVTQSEGFESVVKKGLSTILEESFAYVFSHMPRLFSAIQEKKGVESTPFLVIEPNAENHLQLPVCISWLQEEGSRYIQVGILQKIMRNASSYKMPYNELSISCASTVVTYPRAHLRAKFPLDQYRKEFCSNYGFLPGEEWIASKYTAWKVMMLAEIDASASLTRLDKEALEKEPRKHSTAICPLVGPYSNSENGLEAYTLVYPYCKNGTIHDWLTPETKLLDRLLVSYLLVKAVAWYHSTGRTHRDLKTRNVLVMNINGMPHPLLIDQGSSGKVGDTFKASSQLCTTICCLAPEYAELLQSAPSSAAAGGAGAGAFSRVMTASIVKDARDDTKLDIWGLGILLGTLIVGKGPFDIEELTQAAQKHRMYEILSASDDLELVLNKWLPKTTEIARLIHGLLSIKPERRSDLAAVAAGYHALYAKERAATSSPPLEGLSAAVPSGKSL